MTKPDWKTLTHAQKVAAVDEIRAAEPTLSTGEVAQRFANCSRNCIAGIIYRKRKFPSGGRPRQPIGAYAPLDVIAAAVFEAVDRSGRQTKAVARAAGYDDGALGDARTGRCTTRTRTLADVLSVLGARVVVLLPGEEMPKDTSADG